MSDSTCDNVCGDGICAGSDTCEVSNHDRLTSTPMCPIFSAGLCTVDRSRCQSASGRRPDGWIDRTLFRFTLRRLPDRFVGMTREHPLWLHVFYD